MGCDIHTYVEYRKRNLPKDAREYEKQWRSFTPRINPGRNYMLFALLASVRGDYPQSLKPKGMPKEKPGYYAERNNQCYISETSNEEGCVTLETAQRWATYGCKIINDKEGKPTWVTHPDWHSHSWLTTRQYAKVLKIYETMPDNWGGVLEYEALLAMMRYFEKKGYKARIVFWFDN